MVPFPWWDLPFCIVGLKAPETNEGYIQKSAYEYQHFFVTSWCMVFLEKKIVTQAVKVFPVSMKP